MCGDRILDGVSKGVGRNEVNGGMGRICGRGRGG